jgi:hypothetical protein
VQQSLWEQNQILNMQIEDAVKALMDLRKAYTLMTYHHWERAACRWVDSKCKNDYEGLCKGTRDLGYPVHKRLENLNLLVNTLKHNSEKKASRLRQTWPSVLNADPITQRGLDWYEAIVLNDRDVHEVFGIVRGSGPTAKHLPSQKLL